MLYRDSVRHHLRGRMACGPTSRACTGVVLGACVPFINGLKWALPGAPLFARPVLGRSAPDVWTPGRAAPTLAMNNGVMPSCGFRPSMVFGTKDKVCGQCQAGIVRLSCGVRCLQSYRTAYVRAAYACPDAGVLSIVHVGCDRKRRVYCSKLKCIVGPGTLQLVPSTILNRPECVHLSSIRIPFLSPASLPDLPKTYLLSIKA